MKKLSAILSLFAIASLLQPLVLLADAHEDAAAPPPLSDVWVMQPKQGMEAEFAKAVAKHTEYRDKNGETRSWQVFDVEIGDKIGAVTIRSCCYNWADQDEYKALEAEKGFGEDWNKHVHQFVDHYHHYLEEVDYENSHWPEGTGNGPYYGVSTFTLKADSVGAFSRSVKKISEIAKDGWANDENTWLWLSRIGGGDKVALVSSYESFAAMKEPEKSFFEFLTEKVGEEDAVAVMTEFNSGIASSDYTIWHLNGALSSDGPADE